MPHMELTLTARKHTTREGDHEDDKLYKDQVKQTITDKLKESGFVINFIKLEFAE